MRQGSTQETPLKTDRSKVKRGAKRASYDKQVVLDIIDASLMCHVAHCIDGQPFVVPTCHCRDGDFLYWHGLSTARNVKQTLDQNVCINITQLDALVMARSAMHHSVNYRSVTLFGIPEAITDPIEKERHLKLFLERVSPGRWDTLRPVTEQEIKATGLVRIPINEASAKIRAEGPVDDKEDEHWPVWAGLIPLEKHWGQAIQYPKQGATQGPEFVAELAIPNTPNAF